MNTIRFPSLSVTTVGLLVAAAVLAVVGGTRTSEAQGAIEMGVDMEVTGNSADTLGTLERCYEIDWSGTPFDGIADWTIDVYVRGDTLTPLAYDAWVTYDNSKVHVLQATPTDPLIKMADALDLSAYHEEEAAFGAIYVDPPYDGIPGDGALVRIGLDIGDSGVVAFGFAEGAYVSHPGTVYHPVTTRTGKLAINSTCPAVGAVGGMVEIEAGGSDTSADLIARSSADSSALNHSALAALAAAGALALVAGGWYATRRWGK